MAQLLKEVFSEKHVQRGAVSYSSWIRMATSPCSITFVQRTAARTGHIPMRVWSGTPRATFTAPRRAEVLVEELYSNWTQTVRKLCSITSPVQMGMVP